MGLRAKTRKVSFPSSFSGRWAEEGGACPPWVALVRPAPAVCQAVRSPAPGLRLAPHLLPPAPASLLPAWWRWRGSMYHKAAPLSQCAALKSISVFQGDKIPSQSWAPETISGLRGSRAWVTLDTGLSIHSNNLPWALALGQAVCQALPMRALPLGGSPSSRGIRQHLNKQKTR